ncbi:hypothetical protein NERG_00337 [Nematocida ausubeli]|uniref:GP-PDE domain-containing protein n=1 Tax=Nematocida ausubeli (strain ATCC PRA-371 / ERTm2) TaxID=1913371 RepID=H8Z9R6_NEMA1|nr:hypothetical protein NERG_00337 [Nematocida ausubeli]
MPHNKHKEKLLPGKNANDSEITECKNGGIDKNNIQKNESMVFCGNRVDERTCFCYETTTNSKFTCKHQSWMCNSKGCNKSNEKIDAVTCEKTKDCGDIDNSADNGTIKEDMQMHTPDIIRSYGEVQFIGHRGMGNGHVLGENTVAAILACGKFLKMAEIDVQLSRDEVVFVHHDLSLNGMQIDRIHSSELLQQGVLLFSELLRSTEIGLNVEVKFEQQNISAEIWCKAVLDVVAEHGKGREIVYSSFSQEVCTELRKHTQSVLFLVEKLTEESVKYAETQRLPGIVTEVEEVLNNLHIVKMIREKGLSLITYGKGNSEFVKIEEQLRLGVCGIIADSVESVFERYIRPIQK